jgi:hypothetical protein
MSEEFTQDAAANEVHLRTPSDWRYTTSMINQSWSWNTIVMNQTVRHWHVVSMAELTYSSVEGCLATDANQQSSVLSASCGLGFVFTGTVQATTCIMPASRATATT